MEKRKEKCLVVEWDPKVKKWEPGFSFQESDRDPPHQLNFDQYDI